MKNLVGQEEWELRGANDARLAALQTRATDLQTLLDGLQSDLDAAEAGLASVLTEVDALQVTDLTVPIIGSAPGNIASDGAGWSSGQRFRFIMTSAVTTFVGGNANITFPSAFPNGLGSVIAANGDGPGDVVLNTSNYSKAQFGISAIVGGAVVNGGLRVNYIAIGW